MRDVAVLCVVDPQRQVGVSRRTGALPQRLDRNRRGDLAFIHIQHSRHAAQRWKRMDNHA